MTRSYGLANWVDVGRVNGSMPYLYATSLHWSLTQFTPASMEISARNIVERLYSVCVLLFAMLVFSSIVASITTSMTALRNLQGNEMRQFWLLRRYLRQRNIPKSLSDRIIKFLEHRSTVQGKLVQRDKVPVLGGLSEALHNELMHEMYSPELARHSFFDALKSAMPAVMHRLCRVALKLHCYAEKEMAFSAGDEAKKMYFIKTGALEYTQLNNPIGFDLQNKEWLSEAVLFTTWRHRGNLLAMTESELLSVDPEQFMIVMSVHPKPWHYAVFYARKFIQLLNSSLSELTDVVRDAAFYDGLMQVCKNVAGQEEEQIFSSECSAGSEARSPKAVHPSDSALVPTSGGNFAAVPAAFDQSNNLWRHQAGGEPGQSGNNMALRSTQAAAPPGARWSLRHLRPSCL